MSQYEDISVVILAGGEGRRMGGRDKGLLDYRGKPLIEHMLALLPAGVGHTIISANRNLDRYRAYGEVVVDREYPSHGPLSGLLEAMKLCRTEYLLCLPCDTPGLPEDLLQRLLVALQETDSDVAIAATAERSHYAISLMKCSLEGALRDYLGSGQRRLGQWLQQQRHCTVLFPDDKRLFANINRAEDLDH